MPVPTWIPRCELALPNELLHKIILQLLCDSIHTLCVSPLDTTWEKNIMETLRQVSPEFKDIASEIAAKTFDLSKIVRQDDTCLRRSLREIFRYLHLLGMKLRHRTEWNTTSLQTIDCTAPTFVFAYALYLRCMSLRRNSSLLTPETFESTQGVIFSSLKQSEALCTRVFPVEMTHVIHDKVQIEFDLARNGLAIVRACHELSEHANSMLVLQPSIAAYGTGPLAAVRSLIHNSLTKLEAVHGGYAAALAESNNPLDCTFYRLPGVLSALQSVGSLSLDEDEYDLLPRLRRIVKAWPLDSPVLITECATHLGAGTLIEDGELLPTIAIPQLA